jgi:hypothetical protein
MCGETKPNTLDFFPPDHRRNGTQSVCRDCCRLRQRSLEYRKIGREWTKTPEAKAKRAATMREWRKMNPSKAKARDKVGYALRSGKLRRGPCCRCGTVPAQAHHHLGYDPEHWLDVIWLCRECHVREHHPMP